jgi:hypothetical protein
MPVFASHRAAGTARRLPTFLIAGAQKAGSSWLAGQLGQHPDVFLPGHEVHFFDFDSRFNCGLPAYATYFERAPTGAVLGEKTPNYMLTQKADGTNLPAAARIARTLPDVRLLFVLRDPVARALSALRHHMWHRRFPPWTDIEQLLLGSGRCRAEKWNILSHGLYGRQFARLLALFPRSQMRVWLFESDVHARPTEMLREAAAFIGVDPDHMPATTTNSANRSVSSPLALTANYFAPALGPAWQVLDRATEGRVRFNASVTEGLRAFYASDTALLADLMDIDLRAWQPA